MTALVRYDNVLAEHAAEIRQLGRRALADVIEIGRRLSECRIILKAEHRWCAWLKSELGLSPQSASRFLQIHALSVSGFSNLENCDLPVSAFYLLTAPSTPEPARTEIIEHVKAGEAVSVAEVREIIDTAKGRNHRPKRNGKTSPPHADDPVQEPCEDCTTPEETWQRSLVNIAGDMLSMRAFWTRQFGDWEKFNVTSDLVTLAEQASEELIQLSKMLRKRISEDER
jgi:DUF3102 family protein